MKIIAALIFLSALVVGIVPQFTDCQSKGHSIQLASSRTIPMKCHWTARAEIALAAPLLLCGALIGSSRKRGAHQYLGAMSVALGVCIVLLPTVLIGVCASSDMQCAALMKPILILAGSLASILGAVCLAADVWQTEPKENGFAVITQEYPRSIPEANARRQME
jgi:hypothetical protein